MAGQQQRDTFGCQTAPIVFTDAPAAPHAGNLQERTQRLLIQPLLGGKRPIVEAKPTFWERSTARRNKKDGEAYEKSREIRHFPIFPYPEETELTPSRTTELAREGQAEGEGSNAGRWMYNR
jgi:hypothetical protein